MDHGETKQKNMDTLSFMDFFLDLVIAISKAIHMIRYEEVDPSRFNDELKDMYSWSNVAERTEKVIMLKKETTAQHDSLWEGIIFS